MSHDALPDRCMPHSAPPALRGVHGVVARARRRGGVPFEISVGGSEGHGDGSLEALRSTVKNWCVG